MVDPKFTAWLLGRVDEAAELYRLHNGRPRHESVDQAHAVGYATGRNLGAVEAYFDVARQLRMPPDVISIIEATVLGLDEPQSDDPQLEG
ncbi:MAG TPA: hypothetical protein VIJ96_20245 [Acidothermaceae bacterium]